MAALDEEGLASTDPVTGEDSESEVEAVGGLNVHLAQVMSCYQREEQKCIMCGLPSHFASPTVMHLGDGTGNRQIPKGQGKAAHPPWDQRISDLR